MLPPGEALRLIRPKHWVKNGFVLAPVIFARELFVAEPLILAVRAFFAFCLCASIVYITNDLLDAEADRLHPVKRRRPIAAGTVSLLEAVLLVVALFALTVATVQGMDRRFIVVLCGYVALNLAYSLGLKRVPILDVFIIAAGFMMRVVGGAYAINVKVSSWIVLCSLFISLFLGFAKRRAELVLVKESGLPTERKVLGIYRVDYIDQLLTVSAAGTVISYAMYSVAPRTIEIFGTDKLIYTTVFVLYGIFRYLYIIHASPATDNPTNIVTSDRGIILTTLLWIVSCIVIIYFGKFVPSLGV
jgi:4-hydroxybenzoate polyprenyltransferase